MLVLENLRPILESIHQLLNKKMDKIPLTTDEEILELLAYYDWLNILIENEEILVDENNNILII